MRPRDVRRATDIRKLSEDNFTVGNYWVLVEGTSVVICEQSGPQRKQFLRLPRQTFDALADWYFRDQRPTPSRKETR
jgi:hypothetical protein